MKNAEVQQKAAALSGQFRTLAQNFREIDPAGGYQRVQELAGFGAKLCKKAHDAGMLDLRSYKRGVALRALCEAKETGPSEVYEWLLDQLPAKEECSALLEQLPVENTWPSMDLADMWAGTWMAIVFHLCTDHPEELPCNPFVQSGYLWHVRGQTPRNAITEWRSLAQNYAIVADWLAAVMDGDKKADDSTTPPGDPKGVRGVTLQLAAEQMRPGEPHSQEKLIKQWRNCRRAILPDPIGKTPGHSQRNLYEPAALIVFLENYFNESVAGEYGLSKAFREHSQKPSSIKAGKKPAAKPA